MRMTHKGTVVRCQHCKDAGCKAAFVFLVIMMWTASAFAQFTTAQLSGTVMDESGSAVAGAVITVEQLATGYKQTGKTGPDGNYLFPSLPVGSDTSTIEMTAFTTYALKGVALTVGQAASQNVTL